MPVDSPELGRKLEEQGRAAPESPTKYLPEIIERQVRTGAELARKPRNRRLALLLVLFGVALALTAGNVLHTALSVRAIGSVEAEASATFTIYLVAQAVELYRDSAGSWPPSLEVVRVDERGVEYTVTTGGYTLAATVGDTQITYRSGEDLSTFARAYQLLARDRMR